MDIIAIKLPISITLFFPEKIHSVDFKTIIFLLIVFITNFTGRHIANKNFTFLPVRLLQNMNTPFIS